MESVLGAAVVAAVVGALIAAAVLVRRRAGGKDRALKLPPAVPGVPVFGNLLQLKEKKPHHAFAKWAEAYGPIYSIKLGANFAVVLNTAEVAKEAMIEKFPSISTRKISKVMSILSRDKKLVAISDDGDFHKSTKRYIMTSMLGGTAQIKLRHTRDTLINSMVAAYHKMVIEEPTSPVNFREVFEDELFRHSLTQALGEDISSVYVEEYGKSLDRHELYLVLVGNILSSAIEIDWRDFFPYLSWVPNRGLERRMEALEEARTTVVRALINQQKKRIARGEARFSYLDFLLGKHKLTEEEVLMLIWEAIAEGAESTFVTTEWAMYEIAKHPEKQERLYKEIREVCGNETLTEDHLPQLPYLNAVFHETLRVHAAAPVVIPRYVHEDTTLAGYDIPAGTQVIINIYACNMNKKDWDEPEKWNPERFLDDAGSLDVAHLYKTMAFGAGRRVCAGAMQAATISSASIGRFVQEFEWKLLEGDVDQVDTAKLTAFKLNPLHVYLTPRGSK